MRRLVALVALGGLALPASACGLPVQGGGDPPPSAPASSGGGGETHGSTTGGGASSGGADSSVANGGGGNDGGAAGDTGSDAAAACAGVLCGAICQPAGTQCCTSASECPDKNDVCLAGVCTLCGAPGTDGQQCKDKTCSFEDRSCD